MDSEQQIKPLIEALKQKCKELGLPVFVLVQTSKETCALDTYVPEGFDGPVRTLSELIDRELAGESDLLGLVPTVTIS
jgi:hypothetical protein